MRPLLPLLALLLAVAPASARASDDDLLAARIEAAGPLGTVVIEETLELCRPAMPAFGQKWQGGGTLRRCPVPRTVLAEDALPGDTTVRVASTEGFEADAGWTLGFGIGAMEAGEGACAAHWVQDVGDSTLEFAAGLCQAYPAGTPVYATFPLVSVRRPYVNLRELTLDGREAEQPPYHAWNANTHNLVASDANRLHLEDVSIVGAWGSGLHLLDSNEVTLDRVRFEDVRCGAIHIGHTEGLQVIDSTFRRIGTEAEACGHSEGALTYSLDNEDVEVSGSCFEDVRNPFGAIGRMNLEENQGLWLEANRVCEAEHLLSARLEGSGTITALDNRGHPSGVFFDVPLGADFYKEGTVRLDPAVCRCPGPAGDADFDGVDDDQDVCLGKSDPDQRDADADGYGDACDCDHDQDGLCNLADFWLLIADLVSGVPTAPGATDQNGDGTVNLVDFLLFVEGLLAGLPGPSAVAP